MTKKQESLERRTDDGFTDKTEKGFETLIVNWLVDQDGYQQGTNEDYNKEYAIDETRLFRF